MGGAVFQNIFFDLRNSRNETRGTLMTGARLKHYGWGREGEGMSAEERKFVLGRYRAKFATDEFDTIAVPGACTENLNPNVLMMKSTQDSVRTYDAGSLYRPRNRRIFMQRSMRSDAVVIIGVRFQNAAQMLLAEDNEVIQTLTPDRSDQPFGKAILPR
jgi:hypothetical protein